MVLLLKRTLSACFGNSCKFSTQLLTRSKKEHNHEYQNDSVRCHNTCNVFPAKQSSEDLASLYKAMDQSRLEPDMSNYASLIRSCKSLSKAQSIHEELHRIGLGSHPFLGNLLIRTYAHCGCLELAFSLFSETSLRDIYTWNIIIGAFLLHGEHSECFFRFKQMQLESIIPDKCSFVSVLSACAKDQTLHAGKQIHSRAICLDLDSDVRVGTSLLELYRKCGCIVQMDNVLSRIENKDVFSWTAVISAHAKHGRNMDALLLFQQMLQESVFPDSVIFASVIASCDSPQFLSMGKQVHASVVAWNCESDVVVGTALVNMYGKCGVIENASNMFNRLLRRDLISWNTMIAMYAKHGLVNDAMKIYKTMLQEEVKPDQATFVSLLEACTTVMDGISIQNDIMLGGFKSDILVSTSLVNMYARCGSLDRAHVIFENMPKHDIVSFNVMIDACAQHDKGGDALQLFWKLHCYDIIPNKITYLNILQACSDGTRINEGREIHNGVAVSNLESDLVVATALLCMYGKCGSIEDAWELFNKMPERNIISWNAMITAYVQHSQAEQALYLFEQMQVTGDMPNKVTYLGMLSLFQAGALLMEGKKLHSCLLSICINKDVTIANALLSMYSKSGNIKDALTIFRDMPDKDVVSWTTVMSAFSQGGLYKDCYVLFEQMQRQGLEPDKSTFSTMIAAYSNPETLNEGMLMHCHVACTNVDVNVDICNSLINMYGKCGSLEDALHIFGEMHTRNKQTYVNILTTCASFLSLSSGKSIYSQMMLDSITVDGLVGNNLINMYGKCGYVYDARRIFDRMHDKDIISWSTMITIYAHHGKGEDAITLFHQMRCKKVWPNEVTFLGILSACNHAGLTEDCWHFFISMTKDYGISPTEDHYNCVIDLLSRSGRLEEAEDLILQMPPENRCVPWMTLLGACIHRVDVVKGERAAREVFRLDPKNPVPYVMLANMYTMVGREDDAEQVLKNMKHRGLHELQNEMVINGV